MHHTIQPLTRAVNVMSDDRSFVKYKRTQQRRMQLWPHKWDWWWSHHTRDVRNVAVQPVIEMRIVIEGKLVER